MGERFAQGTTVSVPKSRAEIETMLTRYGAKRFAAGWDGDAAVILFEASDRHVRFRLPLPTRDDPSL